MILIDFHRFVLRVCVDPTVVIDIDNFALWGGINAVVLVNLDNTIGTDSEVRIAQLLISCKQQLSGGYVDGDAPVR